METVMRYLPCSRRNCGARHFSSHWNQLFLLVFCCLMNFLK